MALELKQQLKLSQQLVMTPQLQQAIKLLQLSQLELLTTVQQELVENPMLEEVAEESGGDDESDPDEASAAAEGEREAEAGEPYGADRADEAAPPGEPVEAAEGGADEVAAAGDDGPGLPEPSTEEVVGDVDWDAYMESRPQTSMAQGDESRQRLEDNLTPRESLSDHLTWQLGFAPLSGQERSLAALIIGNLDERGYLGETLESIAEAAGADLDQVAKVLERVQTFDPVGVAARDLRECLLIQVRALRIEDVLVLKLIDHHLDLLQRRDYRAIARAENVTIEAVAAAADVVGALEPLPGRAFSDEDPIYITPDIYVHKVGDEYHVVLNEDGMPRLKVSQVYRRVLAQHSGASRETREYVREKLRSAQWLIKSIHQRQRTIVRVTESIVRFQREFFDHGTEHLRPLNLRDVAEDIGMHESTVSRVTTNKYAQTSHGVFELKFFFNSSIQTGHGDAIASESVKEKIRQLIASEDTRRPFSDQKIAQLLSERDSIHIARRTVTKYREAMRILSSTSRKRFS
jgi:RNA polymerase sigma-54 factor